MDGDILGEIPNEDLEKLATIYEKHKLDYPYVWSTIRVGMRWKRTKPFDQKVIFLSPNGCWPTDGTFLAIFTFTVEADVVLFTLEKSMKNLYEGIRRTRRKQFDGEVNFYATHSDLTETVKRACEDRKMRNTLWIESVMMRMPLEVALESKIECPAQIELKRLRIEDVPKINSVWPRKYDGSDIKLANLIEINGGIGAYLKESGELTAWVLCDQMGQIAVLQTDKKHKRSGYASLVTKALSKQLALDGVCPFAGINSKNDASMCMFKKIGFEEFGRNVYFYMAAQSTERLSKL